MILCGTWDCALVVTPTGTLANAGAFTVNLQLAPIGRILQQIV